MSDYINDLVKELDSIPTSVAEDEKGAAEFTGYLNTGCYTLNAILSGSIYGGVPNNKITAFAGEEATGKTFFALSIVKNFLESDPEAVVIYYDTEATITAKMMRERGIDTKRVILSEPSTIQEFRHHALKVCNAYETKPDRPPMLMVLDSLGMLSTTKEVEDTGEGKETRDMTKAQVIKGTFRVLTLKLAKIKVPLILTNHTYDSVGSFYPQKVMSGGSGLRYAASTVAFLSKKKEREGTNVVGNIIRVSMAKSRFSKENTNVELLLKYDTGLDRYYGLLEIAEKHGIIKKSGNKYELENGEKVFGKKIRENPEAVFTEDILAKIEEAVKQEFLYGSSLGSADDE